MSLESSYRMLLGEVSTATVSVSRTMTRCDSHWMCSFQIM